METIAKPLDILELKLTGGNVKPYNVKASEVSELIKCLEDALLAVVSRDFPEVDKDEVFISLVEVKDESLGLKFLPQKTFVLISAFVTITEGIYLKQFENLPIKSIESLKPILKFAKRKHCNAEFRLNNDVRAIIKPDTDIEIPASAYLVGETTIYPTVKRTGGSEPRVALQLSPDEKFIFVDTTEEIAKRLGQRLYRTVGLSGIATWERESLKLVDFEIKDILDFEEVPITEAFRQIRGILGPYWDKTENFDGFLFDNFLTHQSDE